MEKNSLFPIPLLTPALFRRLHTSHQNVDIEIWVAPEQSGSNDAFGKRWTSKRWTELYFGAGIRRLFIFAECHWYIRMLPLNGKKAAIVMHESGISLDFSSLVITADYLCCFIFQTNQRQRYSN